MNVNVKKKNMIAIIMIVFFAIIMFTTGMTFAWFTDEKTASSTATFGRIEIDANENSDFNVPLQNIFPGQVLLNENVAFSVSSTSQSLFARVKISLGTTSTNPSVVNWINNIVSPSIFTTDDIYSEGVGYQWVSGQDGYYYLFDKSETSAPKSVGYSAGNSYIFIEKPLTIPLSLLPMENNLQSGEQFTMTINFQAIQSANLPDVTLSGLKTQFATVFN